RKKSCVPFSSSGGKVAEDFPIMTAYHQWPAIRLVPAEDHPPVRLMPVRLMVIPPVVGVVPVLGSVHGLEIRSAALRGDGRPGGSASQLLAALGQMPISPR